jgi:two-component system sensor histidine kinase UhpB
MATISPHSPLQVPIRVLLVEDDEGCAELVQALLAVAAPDIEVDHANRLSTALACLAVHDFAVIVTDLNLPDSDGLSTVSDLCRAAPEIPVVVLSANSNVNVASDALQRGADHFIAKSELRGDALAHVVREAAQRSGQTEPVRLIAK